MKKLLFIFLLIPLMVSAQVNRPDEYVSDPTTTRGDIIIRDASSLTRLAVGTNGQVLTTDGTDVSWGAVDTTLFDVVGSTATTKSGVDNTVIEDTLTVNDYLKVGSDVDNHDGTILFEASDGDQGTIGINTDDDLIVSGMDNFSLTGASLKMEITGGSRIGALLSVAPGDYTAIFGRTNNATGRSSFVVGEGNISSSQYSTMIGSDGLANKHGQFTQASERFADAGDAQTSILVARTDTTHSAATWFPLYLDGVDDLLTITASTVWSFRIMITGTDDAQSKTFSYEIVGQIERDAANNTTLNGSSVTTIYESDSDFDAQVVADDTNEALEIQVQDATSGGDKVRWVARIELTEVTF